MALDSPIPSLLRGGLPPDLRNPLHEGGDTILVYQGAASQVRLRTFVPRFPEPPPFQRVGGSKLWWLRLSLPTTARIEYRLTVVDRGKNREVDDPLAMEKAANPFGENAVAWGPAYRRPAWTSPQGAAAGELAEIRVTSARLGVRRHCRVYLPAAYSRSPSPLLVVHDGTDFQRYAGLTTVLDNLIASGEVSPLVALFLDPGERLREYAADPRHAAFLVEDAIPHLARRFPLSPAPSQRVLMGASLGAVAALSTAWRYPEAFGGLLLLSGSFAHRIDGEWGSDAFSPVAAFLAELETEPRLARVEASTRAYLSAGRYEALIDLNRRLLPRLRAQGIEVDYEETWDGHHWGSWRDRLRRALRFLLPGPAHREP